MCVVNYANGFYDCKNENDEGTESEDDDSVKESDFMGEQAKTCHHLIEVEKVARHKIVQHHFIALTLTLKWSIEAIVLKESGKLLQARRIQLKE